MTARNAPAHVRIMRYVDYSSPTGCWEWTGGLNKHGYGQFHFRRGTSRNLHAHRAMFEFVFGEIPEGLHLDHICRNRKCVNPEHLEPVSCRENILRGESPMAENAAKTHCIRGHEFTPENTARYSNNPAHTRQCRTCIRNAQRARYALLSPEQRRQRRIPASQRLATRGVEVSA